MVELAAPFEFSRPTIQAYVTALERVFLLERLPLWHTNRLSRLVKRPKLHMTDTGLACALLEFDAKSLRSDRSALGPLLETFVLQELRRQASWRTLPIQFSHFRDRDGFEVDIVLEQGAAAVAGVEVKAGATVRDEDFKGLRKLRDAAGARFVAGVVLYDGRSAAQAGVGERTVRGRRETPAGAGRAGIDRRVRVRGAPTARGPWADVVRRALEACRLEARGPAGFRLGGSGDAI